MIKLRITGPKREIECFRRQILSDCKVTSFSEPFPCRNSTDVSVYAEIVPVAFTLSRSDLESMFGPLPESFASLSNDELSDFFGELIDDLLTALKHS